MRPSRWKLKLRINQKSKAVLGFTALSLVLASYLTANHFPFLEPRLLPLLWPDIALPFVPESIWIYFSAFVLIPLVFLRTPNDENLNRLFYSFLLLSFVSIAIFWLMPTRYPRESFPLPQSGPDWLTANAFRLLRLIDTRNNCAPSLHVSACCFAALASLSEKRAKTPALFIWASLIALSTMTTKQHYFLDVLSGTGLAVFIYKAFYLRLSFARHQRSQKLARRR